MNKEQPPFINTKVVYKFDDGELREHVCFAWFSDESKVEIMKASKTVTYYPNLQYYPCESVHKYLNLLPKSHPVSNKKGFVFNEIKDHGITLPIELGLDCIYYTFKAIRVLDENRHAFPRIENFRGMNLEDMVAAILIESTFDTYNGSYRNRDQSPPEYEYGVHSPFHTYFSGIIPEIIKGIKGELTTDKWKVTRNLCGDARGVFSENKINKIKKGNKNYLEILSS